MKFLVTGATGFLGWRCATLLREDGHDVVALARPGGAPRRVTADPDAQVMDAGDPAVHELLDGFDAILHFAVGAITQPLIDWQNRPTFQQVVEVEGHRARPSRPRSGRPRFTG